MRKYLGVLAVVILLLLPATASASGFSIGPPSIELEVPGNDSAAATFYVTSDFDGELQVSLENIPLRVEPTTVPITKTDSNRKVELTFYGNESLGDQVYDGKVRFLALTGGNVATGIKVKARIINVVEGQLLSQETVTPPSSTPPETVAPPSSTPPETVAPSSTTPVLFGFYIVIGFIIGVVIVTVVRKWKH